MDSKLGIVVLNYNGYQDTINCVRTINEQCGLNIIVCIVDNASVNDSVSQIRKFIDKEEFNIDIFLVENSDNLGFAKGNNVGIKFLREKRCDFVFVLNNDTLLTSKSTLKELLNMYDPSIGLINPACEGFNGEFQEPYRLSQGDMKRDYIQALTLTVWQIFKGIFNIDYSIHKHKDKQFVPNEYKYIIQGNAYILTPSFFENYNQIFPETFLYFEELYLLWYLQKAGLRTVYNEKVIIKHKEAGNSEKTSHGYKFKKGSYMLKSVLLGLKIIFASKEKIQEKYN